MSRPTPIWMISPFGSRKRIGIRVMEWDNPEARARCIAKWGPYRDQKRRMAAARKAQQMIRKLEAAWPCTFLVKGYKYRTPRSSTDDGTKE